MKAVVSLRVPPPLWRDRTRRQELVAWLQDYYPWTLFQSLAGGTRMKTLCRWLSRDALPSYVSSFHRVALWCRRDEGGRPALLVLNASLDPAERLAVHVRGAAQALTLTRMNMVTEPAARREQDGPYAVFELPRLGPWETGLVTTQG